MHARLLVVGDDVEKQLEPFIDPAAFESPADGVDSPRSPNAKYDYYVLGGTWKHSLELKSPRKVPGWFGLFTKEINKTHTALKSEIKEDALLSHPPVSVLYMLESGRTRSLLLEDRQMTVGVAGLSKYSAHCLILRG